MPAQPLAEASDLFRHASADKAETYRAILDVFARAKRQYRLQLRPDDVLAEARWPGRPPEPEEVNAALVQLRDWGNLESHPDTSRVSALSDFYRARFIYRLSQASRLMALRRLAEEAAEHGAASGAAPDAAPDVAKVHETLRDLVRVFESLADKPRRSWPGWHAPSSCSRAAPTL